MARQELLVMMAIQTEFDMTYNIKDLTVYMGLFCLFIAFIIIGLLYMICKLRNEMNAKRTKLLNESGGRYGSDRVRDVKGRFKDDKDE